MITYNLQSPLVTEYDQPAPFRIMVCYFSFALASCIRTLLPLNDHYCFFIIVFAGFFSPIFMDIIFFIFLNCSSVTTVRIYWEILGIAVGPGGGHRLLGRRPRPPGNLQGTTALALQGRDRPADCPRPAARLAPHRNHPA